MKRVILATGRHWFYSKEAIKEGSNVGPYNLVGVLDPKDELLTFDTLPQSQQCRLVLEIGPRKRSTKKKGGKA